MKNKLTYTFILISILEILFILFTVKIIPNYLFLILFTGQISIFLNLITSIFSKKINKIIYYLSIIFLISLFCIYVIYYKMFTNILSIRSLTKAYQAFKFSKAILNTILKNYLLIIFVILICLLIKYFSKNISFVKIGKKLFIKQLIILFLLYGGSILLINVSQDDYIYSPKNLYFKIINNNESIKNFGLFTTVRLDLERLLTNFQEKSISFTNENKVYNKEEYNVDNLNIKTNDKDIKEIYDYLMSTKPSKKNEYTGIFKNKNIIFIIAESFSPMAIRKDLTPTLYKLQNEGFTLNNYYAPLFPVGTSDSEYMLDTSLIPADGKWSMEAIHKNIYPYSLANMLKNIGYKAFAYHNYKYDYYKRNDYLKVMGYDSYLACGNGLEKRMDCKSYPASDYEMIKATVGDFLTEDKFLAYYVTMSGHREYEQDNAIVKKNWNKVKKLNYSYKAKAYLASQIELDKALKELIKELKEHGKLNDTVIILTGDHYPYGLSFEEMQEISEKELDETFEKYRMPFIIYNPKLKPDENLKYCSSLDVLPTIFNLWGLDFDSRLLMGRDVMADNSDLIIFSDRSFITDMGRYNELAEYYSGKNIDDNYIPDLKQIIYQKYHYSRLILEKDFYRYIDIK